MNKSNNNNNNSKWKSKSKQCFERIEKIINNYKDGIFSNTIGKLKGVKAKLHIQKNVIPVAQPD